MASNFDKLANKLSGKPGVTDPRGLAAAIGRRKFSGPVMAQAAQRGVSAASVARKRQY